MEPFIQNVDAHKLLTYSDCMIVKNTMFYITNIMETDNFIIRFCSAGTEQFNLSKYKVSGILQ